MKAVAVFPADHDVKIIDQEEPRIASPTGVKLRMLEVGICGTDKEICAFEYGTPPAGSPYLVLGHESLGEVVEVGAGVSRVRPGDLVVTMVRRPCPHDDCPACRARRQDFCVTGDFTERGIKEAHGFLTEAVVDDEWYMNVVPRELRDVAVLTEPLTIAEKALAEVRKVQQRLPWAFMNPETGAGRRHRALVLGAGPVGLLGAMALLVAGFDTYVYSRTPTPNPKADLVQSLGATYISSETEPVERMAERVGSIDLIYEAVGASSLAFEVMPYLGINGVFIFTGVPGRKAPIQVDTDRIMRNLVLQNQVVFGTVNAGRDAYEAAIRDLTAFQQRWPAAVRALITGRYPMDATRDLVTGKEGGIKNVIALAA
jgi:threonine dehydrogenase-like Zn-dependent dehydrogenase